MNNDHINKNMKTIPLFFGTFILGVFCAFSFVLVLLKRIPSKSNEINKEKEKVKIMMALLRIKLEDIKLSESFILKEMNNIGIYGVGELGQILLEVFEKEHKAIKCVIDRSDPKFVIKNTEWRKPSDDLQDLDLVIITTYDPEGDIIRGLKIDDEKVITMNDFVMGLLYGQRND